VRVEAELRSKEEQGNEDGNFPNGAPANEAELPGQTSFSKGQEKKSAQ
jgi:hypothetical protein